MNYKCYGSKEMNDNIYRSYQISNLDNKKLKYEIIEEATVLPDKNNLYEYGGIFKKDGTLCKLSTIGNRTLTVNGKYLYLDFDDYFLEQDENLSMLEEEVIFLGSGWPQAQYGETLEQSIDRLWYLLDKDIKNAKVLYIKEPSQDCIELLKLFGIKENNIIVAKEILKVKKIIVPEKSFKLDQNINIIYKEIINKIKENVKPSKYKKVYFSRDKLSQKRTLYNNPIDKIFKKNGYKIFYPEKLTLYEKISILKGAKSFVGSDGTNKYHIIFANDNLEVIIINRSDYMIYDNSAFDKLINSNTIILSSNNNFFPPVLTSGPFLIGGTEYLFNFFDDNNFKYNRKDFNYKYSQILDYIFTWSKIYRRRCIKQNNIDSYISEISKTDLSNKLIDLQHNNINESTIPIKTFLFIGKTTKVGSFQIDNFFEIHIFGLNIIKIKLNHELDLKTRMLHFLVKLIPVSSLRQKLRNKFNLPTPPFWKEDEEISFNNLYNKYKNEKDKY